MFSAPDQRTDMERPVNYLQWFSLFAPLEAVQVAVKEAVATVDHPDIRGSMPHNRDSSGAASDERRGLAGDFPHSAFGGFSFPCA